MIMLKTEDLIGKCEYIARTRCRNLSQEQMTLSAAGVRLNELWNSRRAPRGFYRLTDEDGNDYVVPKRAALRLIESFCGKN